MVLAVLLAASGLAGPGAAPARGDVAPAPTTGSVDPAVLDLLGPEDLPDGCVEPNRHLGDWMIHCHVQAHSDLGMFTFLHVLDPGSPLPAAGSVETNPAMGPTAAAGARFRGSAALPPVPQAGTLDYYCSLPLSDWARGGGA